MKSYDFFFDGHHYAANLADEPRNGDIIQFEGWDHEITGRRFINGRVFYVLRSINQSEWPDPEDSNLPRAMIF
ncbi:hypothetical protein [Pseudochrobactrum sp. MP213Fo]|uniref:hypothetical protein n=1 Tax=Pseudochrobactrum sp. MP213Fo TaxID=3022250 RepID=UPI003B9ECC3A